MASDSNESEHWHPLCRFVMSAVITFVVIMVFYILPQGHF